MTIYLTNGLIFYAAFCYVTCEDPAIGFEIQGKARIPYKGIYFKIYLLIFQMIIDNQY